MLLRSLTLPFLCIALCLSGCGKQEKVDYHLALDPSWYPINFQKKNINITGFSTALLSNISTVEFTTFALLYTNWDSLLEGLNAHQYDAILSSLYPYNFNQKKYAFSDLYLPTGPVLILPINSPYTSLKDIKDKQIAALTGGSAVSILETYSPILISFCDSTGTVVNQLTSGQVVGALLPWHIAQTLIQGDFKKHFFIASEPLNEEGLRLICRKDEKKTLLKRFNKGLEKLQKAGLYDQLLVEWDILPPPS